MKKILVLGAGVYQLPLIKKAKEMGLYTVVSSIEGQYPGFSVADKVYYCDTTDKTKILEIAQSEKIDAIVTTGTDVAITSIGYICDKLSLNGISFKQAVKLTDKYEMKKTFQEHNIPTSDFTICKNLEEAKKACDLLGFPVVFKATDKSGSRGIYVVNEANDIVEAYDYSSSATNKDYIIVEKFVDGYEIGIDAFISSDINDSLVFPHDKIVFDNGVTKVPLGHIFPIDCSKDLLLKVKKLAIDSAKAFDLTNSFINMDVMITSDGPYVIELGARCGGTCIPELIERYSGIDYYEMIIQTALGNKTNVIQTKNNPCFGMLITSNKSGLFQGIIGYEKFNDYNLCLSLDYKKNDYVHSFKNGSDRIGSILLDVPEVTKARSISKLIQSSLEVRVL